jgi:ADP-ribose pyrophosphatase
MSGDSHLIETTILSEIVFDGALLKVSCDQVRLPNGQASMREYISHPGAVVVLAFLNNGNLLFERQYRYPLRRVFLELPAGKIDSGEKTLETAQRELLVNGAHLPPKFGVDVLTIVRNIGFGFACWAYL